MSSWQKYLDLSPYEGLKTKAEIKKASKMIKYISKVKSVKKKILKMFLEGDDVLDIVKKSNTIISLFKGSLYFKSNKQVIKMDDAENRVRQAGQFDFLFYKFGPEFPIETSVFKKIIALFDLNQVKTIVSISSAEYLFFEALLDKIYDVKIFGERKLEYSEPALRRFKKTIQRAKDRKKLKELKGKGAESESEDEDSEYEEERGEGAAKKKQYGFDDLLTQMQKKTRVPQKMAMKPRAEGILRDGRNDKNGLLVYDAQNKNNTYVYMPFIFDSDKVKQVNVIYNKLFNTECDLCYICIYGNMYPHDSYMFPEMNDSDGSKTNAKIMKRYDELASKNPDMQVLVFVENIHDKRQQDLLRMLNIPKKNKIIHKLTYYKQMSMFVFY